MLTEIIETPKKVPNKTPLVKTPEIIKGPEIDSLIKDIDDLLNRKVPKYDPCKC